MTPSAYRCFACTALAFLLSTSHSAPAQQTAKAAKFPFNEKLTYEVQWRLVNAGSATVQLLKDNASHTWKFTVNVESGGLVNRLYRVLDAYKVTSSEHFCGVNAQLDAQEGKKHTVSALVFDNTHHKLSFDERDLIANRTEKRQLEIAPCTYEIIGAFASLRTSSLEVGKFVVLPITNGKKLAEARIEAQRKESVTVNGKTYATTRYEAYVFDNVVYKRRGRLLIWITDDTERVPVEFRLLLGFPIGTVTVQLQKQEKFS